MTPSWEAKARERLKTTSLRQTRQRVAVLSILLGQKGPLTHQQIESMLTASMGTSIDRVTLYRVLDSLITHGLAHKIAAGDRLWRFAAAPLAEAPQEKVGSHSHFYCTECSSFLCLKDSLDVIIGQVLPQGYSSHRIDMTIHGRCPDCQEQ